MEWNTLPKRQEFPLFHHSGHDLPLIMLLLLNESILRSPTHHTSQPNNACEGDRGAISVEKLSLSLSLSLSSF